VPRVWRVFAFLFKVLVPFKHRYYTSYATFIFTLKHIWKFTPITMASTSSKLKPPERETQRKRKASYKFTDKNYIGAESNAVTKRLKLSADAAQAEAAGQQSLIKDTNDEDNTEDSSPRSISTLEATTERDNVGTLDDDPALLLEDVDEKAATVKTAAQERSESNRKQ
jgi:hypothetical protein